MHLCVFQEVAAKHTPHYKVLFSGPGQSSIMVGYLPQTKLKRITGMKVGTHVADVYR